MRLPYSYLTGADTPNGSVLASEQQANNDAIATAMPDTGGLLITLRCGTATAATNGTTESDTATVAHGLGRAPASIHVQAIYDGTFFQVVYGYVINGSVTDTSFDCRLHANAAFGPGSPVPFYWIALG